MRRIGSLVALLAALVAVVFSAAVGEAATFSTFSITNSTLEGGKTFYTTVRLASAAPSGGQVVSFEASNSYVTAPAAITIASGKTSASVSWKSRSVSRDVRVTLTATSLGVEKTLSVTLTPPSLSSVTAPTSLALGASGSVTINLSTTAPQDTTVALSVSNSSLVALPSEVVIPTGSRSAKVTMTANSTSIGTVTVSATLGSVSKADSTNLVRPSLYSISSSSTLTHGQVANGTVTLSAITLAPVDVTLVSSSPSVASVPAKVTIPAGAKSATFAITTKSPGSVSITASFGGVIKSKSITVKSIEVSSITLTTSIKAGQTVNGSIRLTTTAPSGGQVVTLSANPGGTLTFPATVTVPGGVQTATFAVTNGSHAGDISVVISATANTVTKTKTVTAKADPVLGPSLVSIVAAPNPSGSSSDIAVVVSFSSPTTSAGMTISFTSSNSSLLTAPPTENVTSGYSGLITLATSRTVTSPTTVTLTATSSGGSVSTDIRLQPWAVERVTAPTSVVGPRTASVTVYLTGAAPSGGATVSLSTNNALVSVPTSVVIPAGAISASFTATASQSPSTVGVSIQATAFGNTVSTVMAVGPMGLAGFGTVTNPVTGGNSGSFNITANTVAPEGGAVISVTSSNPAVLQVPATVLLPFGGGTSVTPTYTTSPVSVATNVTITASLNGSSISKVVTVRPTDLSSVVVPTEMFPGQTVSGTVNLNGKAPAGGLVVTLSSSNASIASVPATVTVLEGQTTAAFSVVTSATYSSAATLTFTASVGTTTKTDTAAFRQMQPSTVNIAQYLVHQATYSATLTLNAPAVGSGSEVTMVSSNPDALAVPASVTVPAGQTSVVFPIAAGTVSAPTTVIVTATLNGVSKTDSVIVNPIGPFGGGTSGGMTLSSSWNVELNAPAPDGGLELSLTYVYPLYGPATAIVPAGQTSLRVPVYAYSLNVDMTGSATATANGMSQKITRSPITSSAAIHINDVSVTGGGAITGTLTYSVPAGPNGYTVSLVSSNPAVVPTTTHFVPAGQTSVTFEIPSNVVTQTATLTLRTTDESPRTSPTITVVPEGVATVAVSPTNMPTPTRTPSPTVTPTQEPATSTNTPEPTYTPVPTETVPVASPES